jgi:hypothetical protein
MKAANLRVLGTVFGVISALSFGIPAHSQQSHDPLAGMGQKAYSAPISKKKVEFEVKIPTVKVTTSLTLVTLEGGMGKVLAFQGGFAYAIVPLIYPDNKSAEFYIFRIYRDDAGNESLKQLEHFRGKLASTVSTHEEPKLEITLKKVTNPESRPSAQFNPSH